MGQDTQKFKKTDIPSYLPWLVCFVASLYFFYEIVQLAVFNTIGGDLMRALALSPLYVGYISASYLYACAFSLLPAGLILDRFPIKYILTISCALSAMGVFLIAISHLVEMLFVGRILTGIGNAFAFLGSMRLASRWFTGSKIALVMGFSVTIGMLGGVMAQRPFMSLVQYFDWRTAMLINAGIGVAITCAVFIGVCDKKIPSTLQAQIPKKSNLIIDLKIAASNLQNWLYGLYTGLLNLPIMVLGALWGNTYLTQERGVSSTQAADITSLIFLGLIIGAPLLGWITDKLKDRVSCMMLSAFLLLVTILTIMYVEFNFWKFCGLFFTLGILSSAQTLSYPMVSENNPAMVESTCLGLVAIIVNVIAAFSQSLFSGFIENIPHRAIFILPIGFSISFLVGIILRYFCMSKKLVL